MSNLQPSNQLFNSPSGPTEQNTDPVITTLSIYNQQTSIRNNQNSSLNVMQNFQNDLGNLNSVESQAVLNLINQSNLVNLINDTIQHQQQQEQQTNHDHNHHHYNQQQPQSDQQADNQNGILNRLITILQTSLPFALILLVKILHQHLFGFFIVIGFLTTLHYSNKILVNQVQLKVSTFL